MTICTNCGYSIITEGVDFCPNCGTQLTSAVQQCDEYTTTQQHVEPIPTKEKKQKNSNKSPIIITCIVAVVVLLISTMLIFREPISNLISDSGEKTEETTSKKKDKTNKDEQVDTSNPEDSNESNTNTNDGNVNDEENQNDDTTTDESGNTLTKGEILNKINTATKKAAKNGSYKWARKNWYTSPLDVGNATDTLNGIIKRVDSNASLDSVVGGFLAISGGESDPAWSANVTGGLLPLGTRMDNEKFLFKGFCLTEEDLVTMSVDGSTYTMQLKGCKNPQKDGLNPLNKVTNDFITKDEIANSVATGLGSLSSLVTINSLDVEYTSIIVVVTIENDVLKSATISYDMNVVSLKFKATVANIEGKCATKMTATYTFS